MSENLEPDNKRIIELPVLKNDGGCDQIISDCQIELVEDDSFDDPLVVRKAQIDDLIIERKNEIIFKEFRRDFSPIKAALIGILIGGLLGILLNRLVASDSTVAVCAIIGGALGAMSTRRKSDIFERRDKEFNQEGHEDI
jgi:hypothetical protein